MLLVEKNPAGSGAQYTWENIRNNDLVTVYCTPPLSRPRHGLYFLGSDSTWNQALQNSILHWSSDHRVHHRHVDDNDNDPYSAKKGLWFAHIGWMLREYQAKRYDDYGNCKDLQKDKVVMWQHNYYLPIVLDSIYDAALI